MVIILLSQQSTQRAAIGGDVWVGYIRPFVIFNQPLFDLKFNPSLGYSTFCYCQLLVLLHSVILPLVTINVQFLSLQLLYVQLVGLWLFDVWLEDVQ